MIVLFLLVFAHVITQFFMTGTSAELSRKDVAVSYSVLLIMFISFMAMVFAERKRTEKKLRDTSRYFWVLFRQSPVGISFGDREGNIIDTNPMFQTIVGRSAKELAGLKWEDITHPDDIGVDSEYFRKFLAGEISGYTLVKRYLRPDGSSVWVNIKIAPLRLEGRPELTHICIAEDISELIKTEQELKERERSMSVMMSNIPGMAYRRAVDRNRTMQFVSEGSIELVGYKPESLIHSRDLSFEDLIPTEYRESLRGKWDEVLANRDVFREEYPLQTATGEEKWVFEQGRGVYDDDGGAVAIEGLIIDITKQKKREDEVRYLLYHDVLTGLYNHSYFEKQKHLYDTEENLPLSIVTGDINGLKMVNETLGHAEGDKIITSISKILSGCVREGDLLARTGGDEFSILLPKTGTAEANAIIRAISFACEEYRKSSGDVTYQAYLALGCATKTNMSESLNTTQKNAEENMYRNKLLQKSSIHSSLLSSLKTTLYERSHETEEHAQRLVQMCRAIGRKFDLVDEQLNELELLSNLHDIGKIGISDIILNKPSGLTDEEWMEMRKHPEIGCRIAMSTQELVPIANYILCHHERWDGKGYPQMLKGKEIPLLSRILAVVDAYDAMTQDRPYRKAMTKTEAIREIVKNAGTQFDPEVVAKFLELMEAEEDIFTDLHATTEKV